MRIAKFISNSGYCSRRDAEKLISKQKVFINNIVCKKPNINVSKNDIIKVYDKVIKLNENIKLWKFYKPIKIICTNKDPQNRTTIFDILPKNFPRVISIGRLDYMSEGLILLTNNGDFARKMELPKSKIKRVYEVSIQGKVNKDNINQINSGILIKGIYYSNVKISIIKNIKMNTRIIFKMTEGKNREIRNICKYFKWKILKLIRKEYGPIKLLDIKPGKYLEIKSIPNELL